MSSSMSGPAGAPTEALLAASGLCRLAAHTFAAEVDRWFYRTLVDLSAAPGPRSQGPLLDAHVRALGEDEALTELAVEYCRLFIGPRPLCPPYGSVQRGEAALGGRALHQLDAFLERYGLTASPPDGLPIHSRDHVALAFALLDQVYAAQAGNSTTALTPDQAARATSELLDGYVLAWVPQFLDQVQAEARLAPYRPVAALAARVLRDPAP
jgi:TorA maturation chaperone TorD